jgi:hypothetical protein
LQSRLENAASFRAHGKCIARFYDGENPKPHKEQFEVTVWLQPPNGLRLHGDVAFKQRAIVVGSNAEEFWLAMEPKELGSSYYWGKWSQAAGFGRLVLSPRMLLEAFGIIEIADSGTWVLQSEPGIDVLTMHNDAGQTVKKVYIYNCDYRIKRIEYFSEGAAPVAFVELNDYEMVADDKWVPTVINIAKVNPDGTEDSFLISFSSVKPYEFDETQGRFFVRRPPKGFEHIYRVYGKELIEE